MVGTVTVTGGAGDSATGGAQAQLADTGGPPAHRPFGGPGAGPVWFRGARLVAAARFVKPFREGRERRGGGAARAPSPFGGAVELPGIERDGRVAFERVAQRRYRASLIVTYRPLEPRLLGIARSGVPGAPGVATHWTSEYAPSGFLWMNDISLPGSETVWPSPGRSTVPSPSVATMLISFPPLPPPVGPRPHTPA